MAGQPRALGRPPVTLQRIRHRRRKKKEKARATIYGQPTAPVSLASQRGPAKGQGKKPPTARCGELPGGQGSSLTPPKLQSTFRGGQALTRDPPVGGLDSYDRPKMSMMMSRVVPHTQQLSLFIAL